MQSFPFIGPAYEARSPAFDAQRCVNLYPQMSETGTSKGVAMLAGTPGLALWSTIGTGPVRGMIRFSASLAVVISGAQVYTVDSAKAATLIGAIGGSGPVDLASNGTTVFAATGEGLYAINPVAKTVAAMAGQVADRVDFMDGYAIWNEAGTGRFRISRLYSTATDDLDFATAEGSPDNLVSLIVDHRELWLFGENSTEIWFNSGAQDFPFERNAGAFLEIGCAAAQSVAKLDNTVFWVSADDRGQGMVYRAAGYQPQRISTHAVEFALGKMARIDDAIAWTYQQDGHSFYVLSFPTAGRTWVFDCATNLWHERAWRNPIDASLSHHRGACQMAFAGLTLVGDRDTGKVYVLDLNAYTDNGAPIPRIRACPHIANSGARMVFSALQLDMQAGVGTGTGQGADPQAMLQWSDDGGQTWGNELWAPMGRQGERKTRVMWRRLGISRDRIFRVTITDPVPVAIVNAYLAATPAAS